MCPTESGDDYEPCEQSDVCLGESEPQIDYLIDYTDKYSLYNWIQQLGIICATGAQLGFYGSMQYVGQTSSAIPLPWLSDQYGRKWVVNLALCAQLASSIGLLFNTNVPFQYTLVGLGGFAATSASSASCFVYMSE